jgi:hypothetical protein
MFCHAGGKTILIARKKLMPPFTSNSTILSSAEESDPVSLTKDENFSMSGIKGEENLEALAFTQFLLPLIALISPL